MAVFRLLRVLVHFFQGLVICVLLFPLIDAAGRRAQIKRWSNKLLAICRVRLRVIHDRGAPDAPRALIVANHVSWLDIFLINAMHPCRFVAKSDIRDWPFIGWMCEKAGTIFISRGKLRDVRRIYQDLVTSLHAGEHVAFFPEGTTAAQGKLLPFHANLFEAAIEADVPIQPYALRYVDERGNLHPAADFVGDMSFAQSLMTILGASPMTAELTLLPPIATSQSSHRRQLAAAAQYAISSALGDADMACDLRQIEPGR